MNSTRRLTNLTQTDPLYNLPLPSGLLAGTNLPDWSGTSADARAVEDAASRDLSIAHEVCRLLTRTDISYVKPCHELPTGPSTATGLRAQVMGYNADVFTCKNTVQARRATKPSRKSTGKSKAAAPPAEIKAAPGPSTQGDEEDEELAEAPARVDRRSQRVTEYDPEADKKLIAAFEEFLDEVFTQNDTADADAEGGALGVKEIKAIGEEMGRVRDRGLLQDVAVDHLTQLLTLMDTHVASCENKQLEEEDDEDEDTFQEIMVGMEASVVSLGVMTAPGMPKRVYNEDNIDRIVEAVRYHIVHNVFVSFDAAMRAVHRGADHDEGGELDLEEEARGDKKKKKKKSKKSAAKAGVKKASRAAHTLLGRVCTIVSMITELLLVEQIQERTVNQLVATCLHTLEVSGIQLLQLRAVSLVSTVFGRYRDLRAGFMDEIVTTMTKLPLSKKSLRMYPLTEGGASATIQSITALIVQSVQACLDLPTHDESDPGSAEALEGDCFAPAIEWSDIFWSTVYQRWPTAKEKEVDLRAIIDNLLDDLIAARCLPEWPAADTMMHRFCAVLVVKGLQNADVNIRQATVELLGKVTTKVKSDARECGEGAMRVLAGGDDDEEDVDMDETPETRQMRCLLDESRRQMVKLMQEAGPGAPPRLGHVEVLQEALVSYLADPARQDPEAAAVARRFVLCRMFSEDARKLEGQDKAKTLQWYHVRKNPHTAAAVSEAVGAALRRARVAGGGAPPLRHLAERVCMAVTQKGSLARNANTLLKWILDMCSPKQAPLTRTRGVRALASIAEADPSVLGLEAVLQAVERSFMDESISVREAAVELVGRHMVQSVEMANKYYDVLARGVNDTGVSVRKRCLKILREVCLSQPHFEKATDAMVKVIFKISDAELGIQELVAKTFQELWFSKEPPLLESGEVSAGTSPVEVRTGQFMHVLLAVYNAGAGGAIKLPLSRSNPVVAVVARALEVEAKAEEGKKRQRASLPVRGQCEAMCQCLLEQMLVAEESGSEEGSALPIALALHAFTLAAPRLCVHPKDRTRFVTTLLPYLKISPTLGQLPTDVQRRAAEQLLCLVSVIDALLPEVGRLPAEVSRELDEDLKQLILSHSYMHVVVAACKAQAMLGASCPRAADSTLAVVRLYLKVLQGLAQQPASDPARAKRALFGLGHMCGHGADTVDAAGVPGITLEAALQLFLAFFTANDPAIKSYALQALGGLCCARPKFLLVKGVDKVMKATMHLDADWKLKDRALRNLTELVRSEEEGMIDKQARLMSDRSEGGPIEQPLAKVVGERDDNHAGGIVQRYWDGVMRLATDARVVDADKPEEAPQNAVVRMRVLELCEAVLRQGMVHPMSCFPSLIALCCDPSDQARRKALQLLRQETEKHPTFFDTRLADGLTSAHAFRERLQRAFHGGPGRTSVEALAGLGDVYRIVREAKTTRTRFLSTVIRPLEHTHAEKELDLRFMSFITDVLSTLPYSKLDEPLLVVHTINRIVALRAGTVLEALKSAVGGKEDGGSTHGLSAVPPSPGGADAEAAAAKMQQLRQDMEMEAQQVTLQVQATQEACCQAQRLLQEGQVAGWQVQMPQMQALVEQVHLLQVRLQQEMTVEAQVHLRHRAQLQQMNAARTALRQQESAKMTLEQIQAETATSVLICLLLLLKRHLKAVYGLSDHKIQTFNPVDPNRKEERVGVMAPQLPMEMHGLDLDAARDMAAIKSHYRLFKKLMGEDSNDYSVAQFGDDDWEQMEQGTPGFLAGAAVGGGGKSARGRGRGRGRKSSGRSTGGGRGGKSTGGGGRGRGGKGGTTAKKRKRKNKEDDSTDEDDVEDDVEDDDDFEPRALAFQ